MEFPTIEKEVVAALISVISAAIALVSAWRTERLKHKFEREKLGIAFDLDKLRKTFDLHIKKEYELYEFVFERIYKAYSAFRAALPIDAPLLTIEQIDIDRNLTTTQKIAEKRRLRLEQALEKLGFADEIYARKPFIDPKVFSEIERFWELGANIYTRGAYPDLYKGPTFSEEKESYRPEALKVQLHAVCNAIQRRLAVVDVDKHA